MVLTVGPMYGRLLAAALLTLNEISGEDVSPRGIEGFLAYRPWETEDRRKALRRSHFQGETTYPKLAAGAPGKSIPSGLRGLDEVAIRRPR